MDQASNQQNTAILPSTLPKEENVLHVIYIQSNDVCFLTKHLKRSENISKNLFSLNIADIHHLDANFS
jgi:hypothetical protein